MFSFSSFAQISFHRVYTGDDYDFGYDLFQDTSNAYYLCGSTSSLQMGKSQALLLKVDSLGNSIWSKIYGGSESESFHAMDKVDGYCIYTGGYSNSNTTGDFDAYLNQLDFDGNVIWDTVYGGSDWEGIVELKATPDSGVVVLARTKSYGAGGLDWWIHKIDKHGSLVWEKTLGGDFDDYPKDCEVDDGKVYVVGSHYVIDSLMEKAVIYTLDLSDGSVLVSDTLENSGNTVANDISILPNTIRFVGKQYVALKDSADMLLGGVDANGSFTPSFIEERIGHESANRFCPNIDSTSLIINKQAVSSPSIPTYEDGKEDSQLYRFGNFYSFISGVASYSDLGKDRTENIISTNDGGIAYIGHQEKYTNFKSSLFFVKVGPNGEAQSPQSPIITNIAGESLNTNTLLDIDGVKVYPNPFKNHLKINLKGNEKYAIRLHSLQGDLLVHKVKLSGEYNLFLNEDYPSGIYFLNVQSDTGQVTLKLIKE